MFKVVNFKCQNWIFLEKTKYNVSNLCNILLNLEKNSSHSHSHFENNAKL